MSEFADLSDPKDFFLRMGLYQKLQWQQGVNDTQVKQIIDFFGPMDAFCVECQQESVFWREKTLLTAAHAGEKPTRLPAVVRPNMEGGDQTLAPPQKPIAYSFINRQVSHWKFQCVRNPLHTLEYWAKMTVNPRGRIGSPYSLVLTGYLTKVGQCPSVADLYEQDFRKYRKLLGANHSDLTRAVGLFAHGVGAGSFVYLRRIFEKLIEDVHVQQKTEPGWAEAEYQNARWDERIKMLRQHLPGFLVDNAKIYSILSKGIHELSEKECLEHFPLVQAGIEFILDDKLAMLERDTKKAAVQKNLAKVHGELKKSSS